MTVFAAYFGVFTLIVSVIAVGYQAPQPVGTTSVASALQSPSSTPVTSAPSVNELVANDVASNLAEQANMPVARNVANLSVSLAAKNELAQTDDTAIVKPQIVQPTVSSREITQYTVKDGDSVTSIAANYGVTSETVRWANNLVADTVSPGKVLTIPPVDGVIYTVKAGDTPDSVAGTYAASKERIISFNDLEIDGFSTGDKIIIPGGALPENQRPGYVAPRRAVSSAYATSGNLSTTASNFRATTGNVYSYGYCTWYVFERRAQMGKPIAGNWGNATSWAYFAGLSGFQVNTTPSVGSIIQNGGGWGGYGHVAIVEKILPNGTIVLSEMNYAGNWGRVTSGREITQGQYQSGGYRFIH